MERTIYKNSDYMKLVQIGHELDVISSRLDILGKQSLYDWFKSFILNNVPDYFWSVPASSTGKYHMSSQNVIGGLVNHTKAAFKIAESLYDTEMYDFDELEQALILMAIVLHDAFKYDDDTRKKTDAALVNLNYEEIAIIDIGHTIATHPAVAAEEILKTVTSDDALFNDVHEIAMLVSSHSGKWNKDKNNEEILSLPITGPQKFVHLCDYISSRNFIDIKL